MKPKFIRASKKQVEYIQALKQEVGETDDTLYVRYSMEKATKTIERLRKKVEKARALTRQQTLL